MYRTEPPTDKTIRERYMKFQQIGCLCAAKRRGRPGADGPGRPLRFDLVIMTKADSIIEEKNISNVELSKISAWTKENEIRFNEQKPKVTLMTRRKRKELKKLEIYLNNKPLLQLRSLKYLGIIFDRKLTFREHINYMAEKCTKLIFALSKWARLKWGAKTHSPEDNIHRRNTTSPLIRSTSVEKSHK